MEVGQQSLKLEYDHVLREMLDGLGVDTSEERGPFEPEAGAYGGGHRHHGSDDRETASIADLMALKRARS